MILVRSPLRITLGGGGTDLPSYASRYGGFTITAAIDHYIYVSVIRPFHPGIYLKYSQLEHVDHVEDIQHVGIRRTLERLQPADQIEITTLADIPAGTGLGSSSSFTTALIQGVTVFQRARALVPQALAEMAFDIEIADDSVPIGKQDQYAAAFGGVQAITYSTSGHVCAKAIAVPHDIIDGLLLFYLGGSRSASHVLKDQARRTINGERAMIDNLDAVKAMGYASANALQTGNGREFGRLLHAHWEQKRQRAGTTDAVIDGLYATARHAGAIGGKLVGAGGTGFLLFYTEDPRSLRRALAPLPEVKFRIDYEGTKVCFL